MRNVLISMKVPSSDEQTRIERVLGRGDPRQLPEEIVERVRKRMIEAQEGMLVDEKDLIEEWTVVSDEEAAGYKCQYVTYYVNQRSQKEYVIRNYGHRWKGNNPRGKCVISPQTPKELAEN